jgi:FAD/FMN-containing dehydrogenase
MNAPSASLPRDLIDRFAAIVGAPYAVREPHDIAPYLAERRELFHGRTPVVLRPGTVGEVAAIAMLANETRTPIVPQGGNTGLVGGQVPDESGTEIVVSLSRLNRIRAVDAAADAMIVEAGVILADAQAAAEAADRLFPLSLAAEGSCQIGGNLSTNAGGTGVLRYGNTRELVMGLEVVLPDGRVWDGLRGLRKDNTGYDLKHLFVGAEGTLGIITAAVLKLFPLPRSYAAAFVAVPSPAAAVSLLSHLRARCGERVTGFELIGRVVLAMVLEHIPGARDPLPAVSPWYVLVELSDSTEGGALDSLLEEALGSAAEAGLATDAAVATSQAQRAAFWKLREDVTEAQKADSVSIKHDVSVPVSRVPELIEKAGAALASRYPDIRIVAFGHVGDGNIHYNCSKSRRQDSREFFAQAPEVNRVVYDVVKSLEGSISAEHGLGVLKRDEIARYKSALELDMMRAIKRTLDPNGIMNPGKVL